MANNGTREFINLDYMDLMADGDVDMKKTMLEMLVMELPTELAKLHDAFGTGDKKTLKSVSHKLKSTLAFVGNESLDKMNKTVERIAKNDENIQPIGDLLNQMDGLSANVVKELGDELKNL